MSDIAEMPMDNLQNSELVIAKIVARLAETGIQNSQLNPEHLELTEELVPFFGPCAKWLEAEGIIRVHQHIEFAAGGTVLWNPTLTSYGFALMGQKFATGETSISVGEAVRDVSEGRVSYSSIGDLVGGILGGFTKALGS